MSYLNDPNISKAALVIVGNEILSGRTRDANTQHIGDALNKHGLALVEVRVVPDVEEKVVEAVNALRAQVDYVFTTGGIGPTHDDITAACIAKAFGLEIEENAEAVRILEEYYGADEFTPARRTMTQMPIGAALIPNPVSGAPGFVVENVFVMAGVPRIMQAMFDHVIHDHLKPGSAVQSKTISCGLPESSVAEGLADIQKDFETVDIGSYPQFKNGNIGLSVVLRAVDEAQLAAAATRVEALISDLERQA